MIKLHDEKTMDLIDWTCKKEGEYIRDYFAPILKNGVELYIANVKTTVYLLEIDELVLPVTVNEKEFENSYVCSPYTHYISYAKEELWELKMPVVEKILSKGIDLLGFGLRRTSINRIVSVNNWFLSTNLYFPLTNSQIERITAFLVNQFPTHTILFRSIVKKIHSQMMDGFEKQQYQRVMSRSVYLFYPERFRKLNRKQRKDYLQDKALMKNSPYQIIEASEVFEAMIPIIKKLYEELYIKKYSKHNPQFTLHYYRNVWSNKLVHFKLLKKLDSYEGVIGYFHRNHVLTTPILGYEIDKGHTHGLYRLLSLLIIDEVLDKNYIGHFSAGAGGFKRNRGSEQDIEYSYFYNKHLPMKSRFVWAFLKCVMDKIVEPMARKMKF